MGKERVLIINEQIDRASICADSLVKAGYDVMVLSGQNQSEIQNAIYYYKPNYLFVDDDIITSEPLLLNAIA